MSVLLVWRGDVSLVRAAVERADSLTDCADGVDRGSHKGSKQVLVQGDLRQGSRSSRFFSPSLPTFLGCFASRLMREVRAF